MTHGTSIFGGDRSDVALTAGIAVSNASRVVRAATLGTLSRVRYVQLVPFGAAIKPIGLV